jgi:hypothetical protein
MLLEAPTTLGSQPHEQLQKTHVPIHSKQNPRQVPVPTNDLIHEAHILNPKAKLLLQVQGFEAFVVVSSHQGGRGKCNTFLLLLLLLLIIIIIIIEALFCFPGK